MDELKKGSVVFMKASSGLVGYGNVQCVSSVFGASLDTISLYGHNQHYKTHDIDKIVESPKVSPWVSVDVELPKARKRVFAYGPGIVAGELDITVAWMLEDELWYTTGNRSGLYKPILWMDEPPIPPQPKEKP